MEGFVKKSGEMGENKSPQDFLLKFNFYRVPNLVKTGNLNGRRN